ncbi:type II toxin-antitoxin system prevent-host-death family antitoxin [bacterium]|nr:type II toxin-antitoxin system prevent-host-death family antitoxin [bacterium]
METVGAYEAKTNLGKLLDRVVNGEKFTITKHGVPVAVLQAPLPIRKEKPLKVIGEIKQFRQNHTLGPFKIKDMIEDGRR